MIHLKTGLFIETKYICIKEIHYFSFNKEYVFIKYLDEDIYRLDSWNCFSDEFVKEHFVINKKYYRELNLKALLNE
jgi:hypothetical protein